MGLRSLEEGSVRDAQRGGKSDTECGKEYPSFGEQSRMQGLGRMEVKRRADGCFCPMGPFVKG